MAGSKNCQVCGKPDYRKPMCFKGVPWCCEIHRKVLAGELSREQADALMAGTITRDTEVMR